MIDELKANKIKEKGARAEELLRSDVFNEAFDSLEKDFIEAWKITHLKDDDGRARLWQAVNLLGKVKSKLLKMASDGKISTKDLADIKYLKP